MMKTAERGDRKHARRHLLALIGGGGVAAVTSLLALGRSAEATHGPDDGVNALHVGEENTAPPGSVTKLFADVGTDSGPENGAGLAVQNGNAQSGNAITGIWNGPGDGSGVVGQNHGPGSGAGVSGESESGPGVQGIGGSEPGVRGISFAGNGIEGGCENPAAAGVLGIAEVCLERGPCPGLAEGTGVRGISGAGNGVHGISVAGPGVRGHSQSGPALLGVAPGDAPAVRAVSAFPAPQPDPDGGLALDVLGSARFSTAGAGIVPDGEGQVFVPNAAVTAASHVSVALSSDPGAALLRWVDRSPGLGFTVHLTEAVAAAAGVSFTYFIVEPASGGGTGLGLVFGDMDCDGDVDTADALHLLRHAANLPALGTPQGCPPIGATL